MPRDYNRYPCHDHFFGQCDDRFAIMEEETIPRRLANSDIPEIGTDCALGNNNTYVFVDRNGKDAKVKLSKILYPEHVNADWNATRGSDSEGYYYNPAFIYNKPDFEGMIKAVDGKVDQVAKDIYDDLNDAESILGSKFLLDADFKVTNTVGDAHYGDIIPKGTPVWDVIKLMLTSKVITTIRFGITANPMNLEEYTESREVSRNDLLMNGFTIKNVTLDGEYHVLAVPETLGVRCVGMEQGGNFIELHEGLIETRVNGEIIYHLDMPSVGTYDKCVYKFREV